MRRQSTRFPAILLGMAAAVFLAIWFGLPGINRWRNGERATPACKQNLVQIGLALAAYAKDNQGQLPDDLPGLLPTVDITSHCLVCPATDDTPATAATPERLVALIRMASLPRGLHDSVPRPRHCSYVYWGKGMSLPVKPDHVVAFEPLPNHGDGCNVLFGNGEVRFVPKENVEALLNP